LLPVDLIDGAGGDVTALRTWVDHELAGKPSCVVGADEFLAQWPTLNPDKMTKPEAVSAAALLGRLGIGIEPDVRLGGPVVSAGSVVLFRVGPDAPHTASPAYTAAATLLHMAVAVGAADGVVDEDERNHLTAHVESALHLAAEERIRLEAHLQWLVITNVKLAGLTKRLATLTASQRSAIGDFLVTVAAADGVVAPDEVKILARVYKLLGLPPESVHSRIHEHLAAGPSRGTRPTPAPGPVTVRPATSGPGGYALPDTPPVLPDVASATAGSGEIVQSVQLAAPSVVLDEAVIAAKLAETAQVSALLAGIFAEDDEPVSTAAWNSGDDRSAVPRNDDLTAPIGEPIAGLDTAHSGLVRALATRSVWSSSEYADLAARFGVMPAGGLDVLNDAAIEICGEAFAEGSDDSDSIEINDYARQELLGCPRSAPASVPASGTR
jgi:uncharacterized tellurite resistance protein B-like protein